MAGTRGFARQKFLNDLCTRFKPRRQRPSGLMQPQEVPREPFDMVGVDIAGPFAGSDGHALSILVFVDFYTNWVEANPVRETTSEAIAEHFISTIISRHGAPRVLLSDQGPQFVSGLSEAIFKAFPVFAPDYNRNPATMLSGPTAE